MMSLDYDGTLTPIVDRPELAILSDGMRRTLEALAEHCIVAIISGRDLDDVRQRVGVDGIYYAGSHGFRISGPGAWQQAFEHGTDCLPILDRAEHELRMRSAAISGVLIERKHLGIAVHYRLADNADLPQIGALVDAVLDDHPELRKGLGKKVFELQPNIDWNKGKAVLWLLEALQLERAATVPVYIGDDVTDEDAFIALRDGGIGIVVKEANRPTAAHYALDDPDQVRQLFEALIESVERAGHG